MGFLKLFSKAGAGVLRLPSGSMTVDREGSVVATTVSSAYPPALLKDIGVEVLRVFREAKKAQLPVVECHLDFASLRITARELRGGAIVFLSPKTPFRTPS
jgi:hypothetical protein